MPRKNEIDYLAEISASLAGNTITENIVATQTANTSSNAVLAARTSGTRTYLLIQNLSDTDMNVNFGANASASTLLIPKNGGGITFEGAYVPKVSVNLICSSANKSYYILEGVGS